MANQAGATNVSAFVILGVETRHVPVCDFGRKNDVIVVSLQHD